MPCSRRNFLRSCLGMGVAGLAGRVYAGELAAFFGATPVARYPYLQNISGESARILWRSEKNGIGTVRYSSDDSLSSAVTALTRELSRSETGLSVPVYQYEAVLPALSAGTRYSYQVTLNGQPLPPIGTFSIRTPDVGKFSFLAFGDSGVDSPEQYLLSRRMAVENPDLVLHTGDIAYYEGRFDEFEQKHFAYYQDMMWRAPFFPCLGNHEYFTPNARPYLLMHSLPEAGVPEPERGRYYSFDWGNAHFISLDSNDSLVSAMYGNGGMLAWLEADLAKTRKFWRIVYFHHPPYAGGIHSEETLSALVREQIVPILERHDVELVLNGHEHSYQRTYPLRKGNPVGANQGTVYITTGGGGSPLYPVSLNPRIAAGRSVYHFLRAAVHGFRMDISAIGTDGATIDGTNLAPPPVVRGAQVVRSPQGALLRVTGLRLAAGEAEIPDASKAKEPLETVVTLDGVPQSLLYVSPTEILSRIGRERGNLQTQLAVATPNGRAEMSLSQPIDIQRRI